MINNYVQPTIDGAIKRLNEEISVIISSDPIYSHPREIDVMAHTIDGNGYKQDVELIVLNAEN